MSDRTISLDDVGLTPAAVAAYHLWSAALARQLASQGVRILADEQAVLRGDDLYIVVAADGQSYEWQVPRSQWVLRGAN